MQCYVTVSETNGVGVNVTKGTKWFIANNQRYEEQSIDGFRVNAFTGYVFYVESGTEYKYDEVEFSVVGNDDGHSVSRTKRYELHYVGID